MKKLILLIFLAILLCGCKKSAAPTESTSAAAVTTAPTAAPTEEADPYGCYYDLIDTIRFGLQNGFTDEQRETLDVTPCVFYTSSSYETLGYLLADLDGDGTDELLIGENGPEDWDSIIYDVFTLKDGSLLHTVSGWERNRYYLCGDGILANEGSGGAALTTHAYFRYSGQVLGDTADVGLIESVIYDGFRDEEHPWFYSNAAVYDEQAEPISQERAYEIMESYSYQKLSFTPFLPQEPGTGLANPMQEITDAELIKAYSRGLSLPEGVTEAAYYLYNNELFEIRFAANGITYTARTAAAEAYEDISGLYYPWTIEEACLVSPELPGTARRYIGEDETIDVIDWYDPAAGANYCLSAVAGDLDGFDITAIARQMIGGK